MLGFSNLLRHTVALTLILSSISCQRRNEPASVAVGRRQLASVSQPTKLLGESCDRGGPAECLTGLCMNGFDLAGSPQSAAVSLQWENAVRDWSDQRTYHSP